MEKTPKLVDAQELATSLLAGISTKRLVKSPKARDIFTGKIVESAVLMLSDIHCGQVNKFPDENGKLLTTYNVEKMIDEFNRLLDGITTINQLLSYSYQLDKLYIFGLGDYLEQDIIFKGQRFFITEGVGSQLITLVKVMTDFFRELLKTFKEIEFVCVIGNHGRFQMSHEAAPTYNNFDYLLGKMMEIVFKDEPRVKINVPESWFFVQKIYDWKYLLHHGDDVYSWLGLPYYGIVRKSKARRLEIPFDVECIGHFHQRMEVPISGSSPTLVNGGWIPKSDFGWRKFGVLSKPEQYYFGVSPKRARSWSFSLDLLLSKQEWKTLPRVP